jgi:hypothetical protein
MSLAKSIVLSTGIILIIIRYLQYKAKKTRQIPLRNAKIFLNEQDIATTTATSVSLHGRPDQVLRLRRLFFIIDTKHRAKHRVYPSDIAQ